MTNWLPIEKAPKDGTRVFVYPPTNQGGLTIARYNPDKYSKRPRPYWHRTDTEYMSIQRDLTPTHFQPIPNYLMTSPNQQENDDTYEDRLESEIREECRNG